MKKRLLISQAHDHPDGTTTIRVGKHNYLLDTSVAQALRETVNILQGQWIKKYGEEHPFGVASAVLCFLIARLPEEGELLMHHNLDSKDLRLCNIALSTHKTRCQANLKRVPKGTFNPKTGVNKLQNGKYRARLQIPGENNSHSIGCFKTRREAQNARIRKYAELQAEKLLKPQD